MNKKALIKYQHGNEKGLMHYVVYDGDVVVMSALKTKKVTYINEHGTLNITFDIDQSVLDTVTVSVVTDKDYVQAVYNYMIETNNAYFEDGTEDLCVLKFEKK
jgi:hypothetical protein